MQKKVFEIAVKKGEIRADINCSIIADIYFSNCIGLAGNLLRHNSIDQSIKMLRDQFNEFYKLLKT